MTMTGSLKLWSLLVCAGAINAGAVTLHVAPNGDGNAAGTPDKPLALQAALEKASTDPGITEVILAGGEYAPNYLPVVTPKNIDPLTLPRLVIRAADGQVPVLSYSTRIIKADAIRDMAGVFQIKAALPGAPQVWERDTRVRYTALATKGSVAAHAGSCFYDTVDQTLYFHTSDGKPVEAHQISHSKGIGYGLGISRPNVTLQGVHFRDLCDGAAVTTTANGAMIRRCHFENCMRAWVGGTDTREGLMEDCTGTDVTQPVFLNSDHGTVRQCRFEKKRDRFLQTVYLQNDCGYQVYAPGRGGTFTGNFCKGYFNGILIKADAGKYIIRHNTIVDSHNAVEWVTGNAHSDTSYNLIVNATTFVNVDLFEEGFTTDHNLFWNPDSASTLLERTSILRGANRGKFNLIADPRFVDPNNGDYRLLPDSPALLALKDAEGKPAGCFDAAPVDAAAKSRPSLSLAFGSDTLRGGRVGEYTFLSDPWNAGGGVSTLVRELRPEGAVIERVTTTPSATVQVRAFDAISPITKMRVTIGDAAPQELSYEFSHTLKLPDKDGAFRVRIEVQNDRGLWSAPAEAIVRLERTAPKLVGKPIIRANDHGLIVQFRTDVPCLATVRYGSSTKYGLSVETPTLIKRQWDANDGGEWIETWTVPRTEFALAIQRPNVKTGQKVHLKIALQSESRQTFESEDMVATVKGQTQSWYASPRGEDSMDRGTKEKPFRTLQYAVDRALPGERVELLPGTYSDYTMISHGGADEKTPLTIEAETPGTVTLDSAKREPSLILIESTPYVTVRDIRILYFQRTGIFAYRSPYMTVEGCTFFNGLGWQVGASVFCFYSPHCTVTRSLAVGGEIGFNFLLSPQATVTYNTVCQQMYAAANYIWSEKGSVQFNNSFCFAGNSIYGMRMHAPSDIKEFRSDYNNLGTSITGYGPNVAYEKENPALWKEIKDAEFDVSHLPPGFRAASKWIVTPHVTLKSWQRATGQDMHSIFADPQYVNPMPPVDRWDWRVKPGSPNLTAGEGGSAIGAFRAAK